jgi:hypothetical protein
MTYDTRKERNRRRQEKNKRLKPRVSQELAKRQAKVERRAMAAARARKQQRAKARPAHRFGLRNILAFFLWKEVRKEQPASLLLLDIHYGHISLNRCLSNGKPSQLTIECL